MIINRGLTDREQEVLAALSEGLRNREIGDKLHISVDTVKTHLRHAFRKLNVTSRTQALIEWQKLQEAQRLSRPAPESNDAA